MEEVNASKEQAQELVEPLQNSKKTRITKMVMHGFKSFAKRTEILFGEKFNCVLGPNGAGKSNVLDSLCFVLGKASSRELRAEKSANLIYNGGKNKNPAKQGEVSIYFDNTSRVFPSDDKEVKISRIVRQTGQSIYRINDKTSTRQQVRNLLALAKIDPDGYNIILQGDIVKFVEMHPDHRRGLIEDISGISLYEEKKHKAMLELDKVEQHLRETELILTERNTYLKELRKDRDQALKYKDMNDKIKVNKASYLKIQIDAKEKEKKTLEKRVDDGNKDLGKLKSKVDKLKSENEERKKKIEQISKEIEEKGEVEQLKLNKQVETLKVDLTRHSARSDTIKNELKKINQRREDLDKSLGDVDSKLSQLNSDKREFEGKVKAMEQDKKLVEGKIKKFKEKNHIDNIADIETKVADVDKKSEELQKQIGVLREKQHNFIREKDKINSEIGVIDDKIKQVLDVEEAHKKEITELKNRRNLFKEITLDLNKRLDEDSNHAKKLADYRRNLNTLNEEIMTLRAKENAIQEFGRADIAVKKILELKNKRPGIYGTVSELGQVNSKYAVALEVAAGNRIKSIVVESDKLAAELITYLKKNKLGRATFLPLNRMMAKPVSAQAKKFLSAKGVHDLAMNLVSYDNKFKNVFSYVFSDTIIVDDINVAIRLGVGKSKFVTLDGDVADVSGAMQGGFRTKKKEAFGFKEKEVGETLDQKEAKVGEITSLIDVLEQKRTENETKITELREKKAHIEGEIIKTEKSMDLQFGDTESSKKRKKELQDQEKGIDREIRSINNEISKHNHELTQLKIEKQKLRTAISQLNNPRLLAELNTFEQKYRELNEEIIKLNTETRNIEAQIANIFNPEREKTEKIKKQLDKDEQEFKTEQKNLSSTVKSKEKELKEKEALAKEFYSKFKSLFGKQGKINEEISKSDRQIDKYSEESRQIEIKVNFNSLKKAEATAALSSMNQEFAQYEGVKLDLQKDEQQLKAEISKFERMKDQIGSVNMRALEVYDEAEKQYNEFLEKKDKLGKEKEDVLGMMKEIELRKKELFLKTFNVVNENFQNFFKMLTTKGAQATLVIENEESPFDAGVRINVKISGSKFLDIRSLSGGEKTMTALAFIFAIQEHEPAPFYVLDEVDAALDKHNSEKLAKMIQKYGEAAQYLMISHNDNVISMADVLYGVSMNHDGVSQVVSLKV